MSSAAPPILFEVPSVVVCALGELVIAHWRGPIDLDTFRRYASVQRKIADSCGGKHSIMSLIEVERVGRIESDAKAFSDEHIAAMTPRLGALAQVIMGGGFAAATARAVVTGQHIVKRPPYATKVFDSVDPACAWIAERVSADEAAVRAAAASLLAR